MKKINVLVYGTLKKGFPNHHLLRDAEYVSPAEIKRFKMHDLGPYPAVRFTGDSMDRVIGELYRVTSVELEQLDYLEGHPEYYTRIPVPLDDDTGTMAWMYTMDDVRKYKAIEDGVWIKNHN